MNPVTQRCKTELFRDEVCYGSCSNVRRMMRDPEVNLDSCYYNNTKTPFLLACARAKPDIVACFLELESLPLQRDQDGPHDYDALYFGMKNTKVLKMLLDDPRVDARLCWLQRGKWNTPLVRAIGTGDIFLHEIKMTLAHERYEPSHVQQACGIIMQKQHSMSHEVKKLFGACVLDPVGTRKRLKKELGYPEYAAAELFAAIVLLCDDYYEIKE